MKLAIKTFVLLGGLLEGGVAFAQDAQEFKLTKDSKVIVNIQDKNTYLIPGGACGEVNWQGPGLVKHECKVQDGGLVEVVFEQVWPTAETIICSFEEKLNENTGTLLRRKGKNCDQILQGVEHEGNDIRIDIKNHVIPIHIDITVGSANKGSYKLEPQSSDNKCGSPEGLGVRQNYNCKFDGGKPFSIKITRSADNLSCSLSWDSKNHGFTMGEGCVPLGVAPAAHTETEFKFNLQ